jgi:uncharacterized protein (UPF0147 family)
VWRHIAEEVKMRPNDSGSKDKLDLNLLQVTPPWDWPEGTDVWLLAVLRDDRTSESDRLIAAQLAGDSVVINDPLAGELLAILRNSGASEQLRSAAAISVGPVIELADTEGFDEPDEAPILENTFDSIRKTLRDVYQDPGTPKLVRRRVLEASVRSREDWHREAVRAAVGSSDVEWRQTAVFSMGYVDGFDREIISALSDTHPAIQYEAVRAAGNRGLKAAGPIIVRLLGQRNVEKSLLLAAIMATPDICREEAYDSLVRLSESSDPDIAGAAEEALASPAMEEDDEDFE